MSADRHAAIGDAPHGPGRRPQQRATFAQSLDLTPSLEIRLEAARDLYGVCKGNFSSQDANLRFELCRQAHLILYGDAEDAGPALIKGTAWSLFEFLTQHGVQPEAQP